MSTPAILTSAESVRTFILAGNATFTLVSKKTGARFTYKIQAGKVPAADGRKTYFAKVLTGSDNTADYTYAGIATPLGVRPSSATAIPVDAPSVAGLSWLLRQIAAGQLPDSVEVWHTGHCCRCGRLLTVPESVESGIGPECAKKMAA